DIFPLTTHTFEGHQLPAPHDADHLLRRLYGDYMQLPDLDKAAASHVVKLSIDPDPAPSPREGRLNGK
ncbi:MAG: LicD family protein, partial [Prevotella sp.]|nr:LicD family protein [Prevotella sp.]